MTAAPASEKIMSRFLLYRSASDPAIGDKSMRGRLSAMPVITNGIAASSSSNNQTEKPNEVRLDPRTEMVCPSHTRMKFRYALFFIINPLRVAPTLDEISKVYIIIRSRYRKLLLEDCLLAGGGQYNRGDKKENSSRSVDCVPLDRRWTAVLFQIT